MKLKNFLLTLALAISSAALTTNASAQEKTRAEVRQELIDAQNNGLNFVTDASYPDVSPIYQQQVERLKMQHSGSGPATSGTSDAGKRLMSPRTTLMPRMTVSGRLDSASRISAVECPPFHAAMKETLSLVIASRRRIDRT